MELYMDSQPLFQRRPLGSFSGSSVAPCSSEGSQKFSLDSTKSSYAHVSFQPPMPDADVVNQRGSKGSCQFRRSLVDDCSRSRLITMALEHFFLQRDPADSSPVYCILCRENFGDVLNMLHHLRVCNEFGKGKYLCPTCNTWEQFKTSSRKKCSWLRAHLGNKIRKGFEEALKRLPGSKQTLCSICRCKIEAAERSSGNHTAKPPWASLEEEGLTAPNFPTSSARTSQQYYNKPQPAQKYTMPRSSPPSELGATCLGELCDTSRRSELSNMDIYSYAMNGPQASRFNFPQGIPEIGSSAVGTRAFQELAGEQTSPISSKPPYASTETSPLASYDTSPTEVSSVAPTHTSHPVFNVSPTSSTGSGSSGPSRRAHLSPGKSFGTDLDNFAAETLNCFADFSFVQAVGSGTMPANFMSHPTVSTDSFPGTSWAAADIGAGQSLTIDTAFMDTYALPSTWPLQHSYGETPTTESFQASLIRAATNPSNGVPKPNTAANENRSPMSTDSPSSASPSPPQSQSPSSTTATASPTSDASGPASTDEAGAGPLQCPECAFQPSGKNVRAYLRKHRQKHSPRRRVKCNYCAATFTRLDNCKNHVRTAHPGGHKRAGSGGISPPDLRRKKARGPEADEP